MIIFFSQRTFLFHISDSAVSAHLALLADGVVQGPAPAPGQSAGAQEEKPPLSQDEIDRKQGNSSDLVIGVSVD